MFGMPFSPLLGDVADGFWFPTQASGFAPEVDSTYDMILWISLIFFVGILIPLFWFPWKYGKKKGGKATSRVRHHNVLEIAWSVLPSFLLVVMFVRGSWGYLDMREPPTGSDVVNVKAYRWGWSFDYGRGLSSPELHMVVNEPVNLLMQSDDVIHSLFIPAFRVKRDVVPGRISSLWFQPTKVTPKVDASTLAAAKERANKEFQGIIDAEVFGFTSQGYTYFDLYCTEYCGKDHSMMQTVVVVHETREEFNAWVDGLATKPDGESYEAYGRTIYNQQGCKSCHSLDGSKVVGPSFLGITNPHEVESGEMVTGDENYIRESILEPMAKIVKGYPKVMPSYKGRLSEDQLRGLTEFIKSLNE
jgi:cytochrome c oxidase subunit II